MTFSRPLLAVWIVAVTAVAMPAAAQAPAFEVASVKPSPPLDTTPVVRFGPQPGGRWIAENATLHMILEHLYPEYSPYRRLSQQFGGPEWAARTRFHITAVGPTDASRETLNEMARQLLKTRFGLEFHVEERPVDVFAMVLASREGTLGRGVKLATFDCTAVFAARARGETPPPVPPRPPGGMPSCGAATDQQGGGVMRVQAGGMTMGQIASFMSGFATPERWPILDRTGLPETMRYNIDVQFTLYTGPTVETLSGPPLMAGAMADQLGLRLEARREPRPVLVIDRATIPSPD